MLPTPQTALCLFEGRIHLQNGFFRVNIETEGTLIIDKDVAYYHLFLM